MLEKKQGHNSNGECKQWGKWCKRRNFLTKKIKTIFSIAGRIRRRKEEQITTCSKKATDERKVLEVPFGALNKGCSIQKQLMVGFNFKKWKTIINTKNDIDISNNTATKPSIHRLTAKIVRKRDVVGPVEKKKKRLMMTWRREQGQETNKELELCKKRILMGEKCRPLNRSGALHYDEHGILLPDDLITT
ncbi:hypothetical protein ACP275_10G117900 [Erythranthe tilingii]